MICLPLICTVKFILDNVASVGIMKIKWTSDVNTDNYKQVFTDMNVWWGPWKSCGMWVIHCVRGDAGSLPLPLNAYNGDNPECPGVCSCLPGAVPFEPTDLNLDLLSVKELVNWLKYDHFQRCLSFNWPNTLGQRTAVFVVELVGGWKVASWGARRIPFAILKLRGLMSSFYFWF